MIGRALTCLLFVFGVLFSSVNAQLALGAKCDQNPTGCPSNAGCQQITFVCKLLIDPCGAPNPCVALGMMDASKADFKFCVPTAADSKGFDCIKSTNAPTPNPTPQPPTPPTPPPTDDPTGDVCRDEVGCKSTDIGRLKGCICNPSGKCTGTDAESGLVLGCNRATNRCGPCNPGTLFCACLNGNACSAPGLACDDGQCMPTPDGGFSLPCPIKGGIGCPCLSEKCSPKYACSSQLSRCISCPPGCKEKCSQAAIGINDTCAGLSTSCMECKASANCAWCGESGCRTKVCPDGGMGDVACASCRGVNECNGGGECIGPDTCKCSRGFVDDAELGCRPENAVPTSGPEFDSNIAIYAGAGGGAFLLIIVVVVVVVLIRRKNSKDTSYTTVMSPVASTNMDNQPPAGMFNCNICGKSYNFQSDLETHTTMRHGAGGSMGSGDTFANSQGFTGGDTMMNGSFNTAVGGGFDPNGGNFGGGGGNFGGGSFGGGGGGDMYAQQDQGWNSGASFDNGGQNWNNSGQQW